MRGQDRAAPTHEAVQAAPSPDQFLARPLGEVVGVRQDLLEAHRLQVFDPDRLYRAVGADRHEERRFDRAVRSMQPPPARAGVGASGEKFVADGHREVFKSLSLQDDSGPS